MFVAPTNAKIQISSLEPICSDDPSHNDGKVILHPADQDANYMNHDLIHDALCFCHQGGHHNSHLQSQTNLKSLIWFPHMVKRMTAFYDACTHCMMCKSFICEYKRVRQRVQLDPAIQALGVPTLQAE